MPFIEIDGIGKVEPSPSFFQLSPDQQAKEVDAFVQSYKKTQQTQTAAQPVEQNPAEAAAAENRANLAKSAVNFGTNIAHAVAHPIQTAENIGTLGKGVLQKIGVISGKDAIPAADAAGDALVARYGSWDAIKKTAHEDPVGFMADLSTAFGGGAGIAKMAGATGDIVNTVSKVGAVTNPLAPVANTVGDIAGAAVAAKRAVIGTPANPEVGAASDVSRALQRDNLTLQDIQQRAAASPRPGMTTLADVGGENVKGLSERIAQTPGAGRTNVVGALTDRQTSQLARISGDLKDLTGTKKTAFQSIQENLIQRNKEAAPLYEAAYSAADGPVWSEELARLTAVPEVQTAMKAAISNWQRDQIAAGYGAMNPGAVVRANGSRGVVDFTTPGRDGKFLDITGGRVPVVPNLQFWDYVKGHLDQMISEAVTPEGTFTRQGRALTIVKNKMLEQLDTQVPEYAQARQAWSGPSAYISAVNDGKNFLKVSAEEVSAKLAGFESDAQREAYKIGAISSLLTKAGSNPNELADITRYLRSPETRGKISAMMPDAQTAAKWQKILQFETNSSKLVGRSLAGSQTARRAAEMADSQNLVGDLVLDAFAGKPPSLFKIALSKIASVQGRLRSATDAATSNLLFNPQALGSLNQRLSPSILTQSPFQSTARPVASRVGAAGLAGFQLGRLGQ